MSVPIKSIPIFSPPSAQPSPAPVRVPAQLPAHAPLPAARPNLPDLDAQSPRQRAFVDDIMDRGGKLVMATFDRVAQNPKELTVSRGEYLEVAFPISSFLFLIFSRFSRTPKIGGNVETCTRGSATCRTQY